MTSVKVVDVLPGTELDTLLDLVDDGAIILRRKGRSYEIASRPRMFHDSQAPANDPEELVRAIAEFAGTISEEEAERRIDAMRRGREEGSRPLDRP